MKTTIEIMADGMRDTAKEIAEKMNEAFSKPFDDILKDLASEARYESDEHDAVNNPSHYAISGTGVEVIDVIQGILSPQEFQGYCYGNVIKYILRAPKKGGAEDLEKARVYLDWLILDLEDSDGESEDYKRGFEDGYDEGCMDLTDI